MHFLKSFTLKSWATYGKVAKNSTGRSHTPVVRLPPLMLCIMTEQRPRLGGYRWREAGAVVRLRPLLLLTFLLWSETKSGIPRCLSSRLFGVFPSGGSSLFPCASSLGAFHKYWPVIV